MTNSAQAQVAAQLDRIESALAALGRALEQEKADIGTAAYDAADELAYIAGELEQIESFWTQTGPEYE